MAITINIAPEEAALTGSGYIVRAYTDAYATTPGCACKYVVSGLETAMNNDQMTFTWPLATAGPAIQFKTTPTNALEIKVKDSSLTVEEWLDQEVIPVMRAHHRLYPFFDVYREGTSMVIHALNRGAGYQIDASYTGFSPAETFELNGVDEVLREDMRLRMRVHVVDSSGDFKASEWIMYDVEYEQSTQSIVLGVVNADLSKVVHSMIDLIDVSPSGAEPFDHSNFRAFVEVAEHYEDAPEPWLLPSVRTNLGVIQKGDIRIQDRTANTFANYFLGARFITNRHTTCYVYPNISDWLWYFHIETSAFLHRVIATVFYTDGTNSGQYIMQSYASLNHTLRGIPCGFVQSGLSAIDPLKTAYKYTIQVFTDTNSTITNSQTFILLESDDTRGGFQYYNSYGVLETMPLEGSHNYDIKSDRDFMDVSENHESDEPTDLSERSYNRSLQAKISLSSIPLSNNEINGYMDILIAQSGYYVRSGIRMHAQILPGSIKQSPINRDGRKFYKIEFEIALNKEKGNSHWKNWM